MATKPPTRHILFLTWVLNHWGSMRQLQQSSQEIITFEQLGHVAYKAMHHGSCRKPDEVTESHQHCNIKRSSPWNGPIISEAREISSNFGKSTPESWRYFTHCHTMAPYSAVKELSIPSPISLWSHQKGQDCGRARATTYATVEHSKIRGNPILIHWCHLLGTLELKPFLSRVWNNPGIKEIHVKYCQIVFIGSDRCQTKFNHIHSYSVKI